jgi:NitT/TauT family transport system permease protein
MPRESSPSLLTLRLAPSRPIRRLIGVGAVAFVVVLWWLATTGTAAENRLISPVILPSPAEVIRSFPSLLHDRGLIESIVATLKRVLIGFGLAVAVGVPIGIVAGSWRVVEAAGSPIALFGRNLPVGVDSADHPVVRDR